MDDHRLAALHYARDQAELNHAFVAASNAAAAAAAAGISDHEALQRIRESREYDSPSPDGMSRYDSHYSWKENAPISNYAGLQQNRLIVMGAITEAFQAVPDKVLVPRI